MPRSRITFLKKFLAAPQNIGSITPSSKYLVDHMLRKVDWQNVDRFVELGSGTGVITEELVKCVKPQAEGILVEQDVDLQRQLQRDYPQYIVHNQAENLTDKLAQVGWSKVDCIICSLPFAIFNQEKRQIIFDQIDAVLAEDGIFVAYQYSLNIKKDLAKRFPLLEMSFVALNVPPAFVYRGQKTALNRINKK